jgi:hypothetical protein
MPVTDFTLSNDLVGAMHLIRMRLECEPDFPGDEPPILYLNEAEYAYFKAHEWIDIGIGEANKGRKFTNVNCPACPAHTEVKISPNHYPGVAR